MAEQYPALSDELTGFINEQPMFFVATAAKEGRVNLSPKGGDSLRVLAPDTLLWQNLTGSGNETAAHLLDSNRMTLMWCAFEGLPRILRVYGSATTIHPRDADWAQCTREIPEQTGTRQYFRLTVDLVQTSCGYAVPLMDFQAQRDTLDRWADKRGPSGIAQYWQDKNVTSLDGLPTEVLGD